MGLIGRIGGRALSSIGLLSDRSKMRWLFMGPSLCQDRTRAGLTVVAGRILNSSGVAITNIAISQAHPAAHAVDGHRGTYCEMAEGGYYLELDLDTGGDERKELLSLRYPQGREIEVQQVQFANEAAGSYGGAVGSVAALYRGERESLWKLPFRGDVTEVGFSMAVLAVDGLKLTLNSAWGSPSNRYGGWALYFTTGLNAGLEREVVMSESSQYVYIESAFPNPILTTDVCSLRLVKPNYLGSRYARVRLKLRGSAGKDAMQLYHVGLHRLLFECVGDQQNVFKEAPSNPARVSGQHHSGQVHTELLDGGLDIEQRVSARDTLEIAWDMVHDGQLGLLKDLAQMGEFCIFDHHGELRQGVIVPDSGLGWDDLDRAVGRGEERAVRMTFREI